MRIRFLFLIIFLSSPSMCIICIQQRKYVINKMKKITNFYQFVIIAKMRFCIEFHLKQKFIIFYYLLPCYNPNHPHFVLHIFHSYKASSTFILKTFIVISHFTIILFSVLHTILLFMTAPEAHMNQAQTHYNPISLSLP